jgi:hypothetical protein
MVEAKQEFDKIESKSENPEVEHLVVSKEYYPRADPSAGRCPFAVIPDELKLDANTFIVKEEDRKYFDYIIIPSAMIHERV